MSDLTAETTRELVLGAVDLYVHAEPDLIPRRTDELGLARELQEAGLRAAVHRHHYSPTAERTALARTATGFDLRGAVLLDATAGGTSPAVVEVALRMGAVWIGLPTIGSVAFRATLAERPPAVRAVLDIGAAVHVVDERGRVLDNVREVLALIASADVVLATGYLTKDETEAVLVAAADAGVTRVVLSNPMSPAMGMPADDVVDLMLRYRELVLEESVYQHLPAALASSSLPSLTLAQCAPVFARVGIERVVLSSDGGITGADAPAVLLARGCLELVDAGLAPAQVSRLVRNNPARLLGL